MSLPDDFNAWDYGESLVRSLLRGAEGERATWILEIGEADRPAMTATTAEIKITWHFRTPTRIQEGSGARICEDCRFGRRMRAQVAAKRRRERYWSLGPEASCRVAAGDVGQSLVALKVLAVLY